MWRVGAVAMIAALLAFGLGRQTARQTTIGGPPDWDAVFQERDLLARTARLSQALEHLGPGELDAARDALVRHQGGQGPGEG